MHGRSGSSLCFLLNHTRLSRIWPSSGIPRWFFYFVDGIICLVFKRIFEPIFLKLTIFVWKISLRIFLKTCNLKIPLQIILPDCPFGAFSCNNFPVDLFVRSPTVQHVSDSTWKHLDGSLHWAVNWRLDFSSLLVLCWNQFFAFTGFRKNTCSYLIWCNRFVVILEFSFGFGFYTLIKVKFHFKNLNRSWLVWKAGRNVTTNPVLSAKNRQ
jgi:hypothetical protein